LNQKQIDNFEKSI